MNIYLLLAIGVLILHTLWNFWVGLGWVATRNRNLLRCFHIFSVLYSVVVMPVSWPCPLTVAERDFEELSGAQPFKEPFVIHYMRIVFSLNLPRGFVIACA